MAYQLGMRSRNRLFRVEPRLVRCVELAIGLSTQDFCVAEGMRSETQQIANVAKGVSWTMDSKHLMQPDGFAHAVDLVPWHDGGPKWEWPLIWPMAVAMQRASAPSEAFPLGLELRWGGVWDRRFNDLYLGEAALKEAVHSYCMRHAGIDRLDGPHFELAS